MTPSPVYLFAVDRYDPALIAERVGEAMDDAGIRPRGRVLVKPNAVIAHPELFPHAFTRSEVIDGVLTALEARAEDVTELLVGERCGITVPTRLPFRLAGHLDVLRRHGVDWRYFDEEAQVEVPLKHPGRLRDSLYLPETVARAEFMVNLPKLKTHPWTTITLALKNYIGIQDDGARLVDHDHRLDEKIVDLNFCVPQRLIVIDGITAGMGRMLTPRPVELGLLVVGNNPVATDAVIARIVGLDPAEVDHLRLAAEAGLGPMGLDEIDVRGDISIEAAAARAREGKLYGNRIKVQAFFEKTRIRALAGPPPEPERTDYCWGGCPGAAEEAFDIIKLVQPEAAEAGKPITMLYGDLRNRNLELRSGEKVVIFGDCAQFDGQLTWPDQAAQQLTVKSTYVERKSKCVHSARSEGLVTKTIGVVRQIVGSLGKPSARVHGCPVSVAEQVLLISALTGLKNPYLDRRNVFPFIRAWTANLVVKTLKRLVGRMGHKRLPHPPGIYPAVDNATAVAEAAAARVSRGQAV